MTGSNSLVLCQAEMMIAVEYYLNEVVFKEPVIVKEVKYECDGAA